MELSSVNMSYVMLMLGRLWLMETCGHFPPLTCTPDIAKYKKVVFWGSTSKMHNKAKGCAVKKARDHEGQSKTSLFCCVPY